MGKNRVPQVGDSTRGDGAADDAERAALILFLTNILLGSFLIAGLILFFFATP